MYTHTHVLNQQVMLIDNINKLLSVKTNKNARAHSIEHAQLVCFEWYLGKNSNFQKKTPTTTLIQSLF